MIFESKDEIVKLETILALIKDCTYPALKGVIIFKLVENIEWLNTQRKEGSIQLAKEEEEAKKPKAKKVAKKKKAKEE